MDNQREFHTHEFFDYMGWATDEMGKDYERIRTRSHQDPGIPVDQEEADWAGVFRNWLPPYFQVETKGRILSHNGEASPQVDVLILSPAYPKKLRDRKYYLAGGVAAAFECKQALQSQHIEKAVQNAAAIKRLLPEQGGSPYKELQAPLIYGLLARSHSWKSDESSPTRMVQDQLKAGDARFTKHPREMIDCVCVSDLGAWFGGKWPRSWQFNPAEPDNPPKILTTFVEHSYTSHMKVRGFTPIGALLTYLFRFLAWEYPDMRRLSRYLRVPGLSGEGVGNVREWPIDIYSEQARGPITRSPLDSAPWSEWSTGPLP
jgi:hypothetical protein